MAVKLYRDEGIVLRTHALGEADRIITLLTRHHGRVRAAAKGVRRTSSRFGARLEPFSMVDVQLYVGRTLDVVTEVATIAPFAGVLGRHYDSYTAASAVVEVAELLTADESDDEHYLLLLGALNSLARGEHEPELIRDSYFLRALAVSGWALAIWNCALCGAPGPLDRFHVVSGGMVCEECAPKGAIHVSRSAVELLGALMSGEWAVAEAASALTRREVSGLIAAYLQWHVERQIRSLKVAD
ncbi:DNA repair protein RecO [Arcanobacterium haemolyticum]|nr:DNA repair protein RecO [Arcanobacterium haemolyticum]